MRGEEELTNDCSLVVQLPCQRTRLLSKQCQTADDTVLDSHCELCLK
jgi:hypothetical protein